MIIASIFQVIAIKLLRGSYEKSQVIGLIAIILFGGLTLWLRSPAFIMWKVSVINLIFAIILIASIWIGRKPLMAYLLDKHMTMPHKIWIRLTFLWASMFMLIAIINAYYVNIALKSREILINSNRKFENIDLQQVICDISICTQAKLAEEAWVNFKLFGSIGITLIILFFTIFYLKQYLK
jgi:intracellular septation protein